MQFGPEPSTSGSSRFRSSSSRRLRPTNFRSICCTQKTKDASSTSASAASTANRCRGTRSSKATSTKRAQYVILTDEDFKKVNPEATQSVDILEFVELDKINPMFFDKPYYLEPTKQGRHAYALLREALSKSNRVAIARVVIRTKEYIAAVKPHRRRARARAHALGERDRRRGNARTSRPREPSRKRDEDGEDAHRHDERRRVRTGEVCEQLPRRAAGDDRSARRRQGTSESQRRRPRGRRSSISWTCSRRASKRARSAAPRSTAKPQRRNAARKPPPSESKMRTAP